MMTLEEHAESRMIPMESINLIRQRSILLHLEGFLDTRFRFIRSSPIFNQTKICFGEEHPDIDGSYFYYI